MLPSNTHVTVKSIESNGTKAVQALPGQLVDIALHLPSDFDTDFITKGNVLCDVKYPIR